MLIGPDYDQIRLYARVSTDGHRDSPYPLNVDHTPNASDSVPVSSISYATPALLGKQRRVMLRDTLGVLTLHDGRLGFLDRHHETVFERDVSAISVTPKGAGADPTAFVISLEDGFRWSCAFWFRNSKYTPNYVSTNYVDVPIEDIDLTDKWQAQDTCGSWLRILADPTASDPKAWHPG